MGEQEPRVTLILPAPACKTWEARGKERDGLAPNRPKEAEIFFLPIQPVFSPSSLLKIRAELFFLAASCSAAKSRGSAASQKEEEVLVSSISPPQYLLTIWVGFLGFFLVFGFFFKWLPFFSAFCTDSAELPYQTTALWGGSNFQFQCTHIALLTEPKS